MQTHSVMMMMTMMRTMGTTKPPVLLASQTLYVIPSPASRPRVTRRGTYHVPKYKKFLKDCVALLDKGALHSGPLILSMTFYCKTPKKPANPFPVGDIDNYAKGLMDAMTKADVWEDDKQVIDLSANKVYSPDPRIWYALYSQEST